ncbi:MAG: hypothetical protein WBA97_34545 [Actinophytocola sp.]|uniref:hypothetical protein n=1 Tax=Actinophytocola sp. TaxID=1872138 RepID=UPI003C7326C3
MATPFATTTDVATLLKVTFDSAEELQCEMVLAALSAALRSTLPDLDTWIANGGTDPVLAKFAVCDLAKGYIQVVRTGNIKSEAHPEYQVVFQDVPKGGVDVSDWIDLLTPASNRSARGKAFSIHPG